MLAGDEVAVAICTYEKALIVITGRFVQGCASRRGGKAPGQHAHSEQCAVIVTQNL